MSSRFKNSHADASLFVFNTAGRILYLLVYVDDIILTSNFIAIVNQFVTALAQRFSLKDLGSLTYFLGVEVVPNKYVMLLSQRRYILDLLSQTKMNDAKSVITLIPTSPSLMLNFGTQLPDPSEYRQVVGNL